LSGSELELRTSRQAILTADRRLLAGLGGDTGCTSRRVHTVTIARNAPEHVHPEATLQDARFGT
jgi:hypothetical protein